MAHGEEIYKGTGGLGYGGSKFKGWKMLDGSDNTNGDSGWVDTTFANKHSLEVSGINSDQVTLYGTNSENPTASDAGQVIGSAITANGITQVTGVYARMRVKHTTNGSGTVFATLLSVR